MRIHFVIGRVSISRVPSNTSRRGHIVDTLSSREGSDPRYYLYATFNEAGPHPDPQWRAVVG